MLRGCVILSGFEAVFFGRSDMFFVLFAKFFFVSLLALGLFVLRFGDVGGESGGLFGGQIGVFLVLAVNFFRLVNCGCGGFRVLFAHGFGIGNRLRGSGAAKSRDAFAGKRFKARRGAR